MISPTLISFGSISIRWYGVFYVLSFILLGYYLNALRKKQVLELSKDQINDLIFYLVVGIIIGARLFHAYIWHPSDYIGNLLDVFKVWDGGMAVHGGLIGAIIAVYYFTKKNKYPIWKLADILIIPAAILLAFGRLINWVNLEVWGTFYNGSFCVKDTKGICRFPYQAAAALKRFGIFLILINSNKKTHKDGYIFWLFILLSGISRFLLDFYKEQQPFIYSLSVGQITSLIMFFSALYVIKKHYKK